MNFFNDIRYRIWPALICCMAVFVSCTDDLKLPEPGNETDEIEGDCLSFMIKLDKDQMTRAEESLSSQYLMTYDTYIDTQDKFRVFFFTEQGDFLFGATDRVVGAYDKADSENDYWYVRIPMTKIVDRDNQEYDIDKIKNYLKNHNFKIAVLANWPNGGEKINPADYDDSEGNNGDNPSSELKGNPKWNWSNSILNEKANPADIRNINDLHHVYNDTYYADGSVAKAENAASRFSTYSKFMAHGADGYYMGEPTDWVKMRDIGEGWKPKNYNPDPVVPEFSGKTSANRWIRANWTPEVQINQDKGIYRHYQHLWFLWNFDAAYKYGAWLETEEGKKALTSSEEASKETLKRKADEYYGANWGWNDNTPAALANPRGQEWHNRNGAQLYNWMKNSYNNGGTANPIGNNKIEVVDSKNEFEVFFEYISRNGSPCYAVKVGDNYGIHLPNIGRNKILIGSTGFIKFQARTAGTLRVKWGSRDGVSSSLAVQQGYVETSPQYIHSNYSSLTPTDWTYSGLSYLDVTVEGNTEPLYIYCTSGNAVVYSIEFIRGKYLFETDREGVAPGPNQGIPMYGVQNYTAIGEWQRGTTINLPDNISLVRALARVEVYIPRNLGEPKHVYMRNMNRLARCEPMDVHSPTGDIWTENHYIKGSNINDEKLCEWFRIQKYGPSYGDKLSSTTYTDWLSWFYGSWQKDGVGEGNEAIHWKNDGDKANYTYNRDRGYYVPNTTLTGWKENEPFSYSEYSDGMKPPHLFNPYYYQNDFCRFLYAGPVTEKGKAYNKYILYLPEKNIDDPSIIGNLKSDPRVPHIEYRFPPKGSTNPGEEEIAGAAVDAYNNTEYNLDDNDCYRIYFTNYGGKDYSEEDDSEIQSLTEPNPIFKSGAIGREDYDEYERSNANLRYHWPILRNHVYKFYLGENGPENPEIHVQVTDWGHKKVVLEW